MEKTFNISEKAYKKLLYKLLFLYVTAVILGVLLVSKITSVPIKLIIIFAYNAYLTCLVYSKKKKIDDVYRLKSQIIKEKDGEVVFDIYDSAQNAALKYTREEPICYRVTLSSMSKIKKSMFTYKITSDEVLETVLRRNPFSVKKKNYTFTVYRIFEDDKGLYEVLRGFFVK